ncbi:MAG: site-specific integrase, partial [Actinomycetota bacterium]|nr:site-specific integrase [Actinomycetota bacterium]
MTWEDEAFMASLTSVAPATRKAYAADLADFISWAESCGVLGPADVDRRVLRSYLVALADRSLAARSTARRVSALRRYFRWLTRTGQLAADPSVTLRAPRGTGRLPTVVHDDQLERLLTGPEHSGPGSTNGSAGA